METYDCIVIGAGPAGMTASIFMTRANLSVLMIGDIEKTGLIKGQEIGNFLGNDGISGPDLLDKGLEQAKKYGTKHLIAEVVHVEQKEPDFIVKLANAKELSAKCIIIATGLTAKSSGAKNEDKLLGRGIHTCVACDGPFYKNKRVFVLGNGNFAAEEAIELSGLTKDITLVSHGKEFAIAPELKKTLDKAGVKYDKRRAIEFVGEKKFEKVLFSDKSEEAPAGIFIALGTATALAFAQKLGLEMEGQGIKITRDGETNVAGVFAAGGCTGGNYQISKSVGEGCNAGISVIKKLKGLTNYQDIT
jgi:thioredoxin reductase (NADPH)